MTSTTSRPIDPLPTLVTAGTLVVPFAAGSRQDADLLGGKGANLCEMTRLGLPVPGGFVISTEVCRRYLVDGTVPDELWAEVEQALTDLETRHGRRLGDPVDPLLVSVRSGARFSMPGMMETVLDVGLSDASVTGLAARYGEHVAWDCYVRLVTMYGHTVVGVDPARLTRAARDVFARRGVGHQSELDVDGLRELVGALRAELVGSTGQDVPADPREQVRAAVLAVLESWRSDRATLYRREHSIPDDLGTAVTIMAMAYGNAGATSGSGVCFTRNPSTGEPGAYGNYLVDAQGEDVVNGSRDAGTLEVLAGQLPAVHAELLDHLHTLESHYRDVCDVEFTVEQGRLWILQTRVGKRTPAAAFRIARDLVREGVIDWDEALVRVSGVQLDALTHPQFATGAELVPFTSGHAASPGAAVGQVAFDSATAAGWAAQGRAVVLLREETSPDDLAGMLAARAIVTARGGVTSHAAVVARGMGRPCVVGTGLTVDEQARTASNASGVLLTEGDEVSVDGTAGTVVLGAVPMTASLVAQALERGVDDGDPLSGAVLELLAHADQRRRLDIYANADNGPDAARARALGAQGVGLCRTEHQLLGPRRELVERIVLDDRRDQALTELEAVQRADHRETLLAMDGLPVVVRLLDPPLHEFLPDLVATAEQVARADAFGEADERQHRLLAALRRWTERNPMLGLRGVRLALLMPDVLLAQVRALTDAYLDLRADGHDPQPHLMVPLVAEVAELIAVRSLIREGVRSAAGRRGQPVPDLPIGTMIELPRAALTAGPLAAESAFFSFGTNDLTQTTWGMSRDDAETAFLPQYRDRDVLREDPFETLDQVGVGRLVRIAVEEGRAVSPDLGLGICGEHGGDPASIHWFHQVGLDYVSCSPPRVAVARLEAGRAAVLDQVSASDTR
jgi:pyruvate,orthophosphate dikinase